MIKPLFDEETLKRAIKISCEQEWKDLEDKMAHGESHVFSGEFLGKMQPLLEGRKEKKTRILRYKKWSLRYAMVAAILFMLGTATVLASEQVRVLLYNVYVTLFLDYLGVESKDGIPENTGADIIPYEPFYIPEGYQKTYDDIDLAMGTRDAIYEKGDNILVFSQSVTGTAVSVITSDGSTMEELMIQGMKAVYTTDGGYGSIIFEMDGYTFYITALLEKEEIIKVADSVSPNK